MTDRDDWLAWRRGGIGASDIAGILGLSPWASPWSVWADKSNLLPEQPDNEYMAAGRWLERAIGPWFTHETGLHVAGEQTWCSHQVLPWARCTPDGFVVEHEFPEHAEDSWLGTFEVKVTGFGKRWEPIPEHYQAQAQWQMFVTGQGRTWFAVLHGRRLEVYELLRDQADIDLIVDRAKDFWHDHVLAGVAPPTDGTEATTRALAAVYADVTLGCSVEVPYGLVDVWRSAKAAAKAAEMHDKEASNRLRAALGDAEEGTVDGRRIVSLRAQTTSRTCPECRHKSVSDPFRVLRWHQPKEAKT